MTTKTQAPPAVTGGVMVGGVNGYPRWTGARLSIDRWTFITLASGTVVEECGRCSEGGVITHFSHVHAGVCFECLGKGHGKPLAGGVDGAREVVRKRLLAAAARARRAERDAEAARALGTVWADEHPELAVALTAVAERIQVDEEFGWSVHTALVSFAGAARRGEALTVKQTEFAQSLVAELAADVAAEDAKAQVDAAKVHLGRVGEPLTVTGTVRVNMSIESTFGYRTTYSRLVIVDDADGNTVKTMTAAQWAYDVEVGDTLTLKGTVKAHEQYQGAAQTVLARPKAVTA